MKSPRRLFPAVVLIVVIVSCESEPAAQKIPPSIAPLPSTAIPPASPAQPRPPGPEPIGPVRTQIPSAGAAFDPNTISKQEHDIALSEVQQLIRTLNGIIKTKNYASWLSYLHPDYQALVNSGEYLERINNSQRFKSANIEITSARDYFDKVVVPSRANDRVDDIEFISRNRVKAYSISRGNKLRLYDLEKTSSGWKIVG
jgi:pyruvate/2-oxoglutarate dehydrogenase complex dihydrolipoamide acyltransferase (E2) component